MASQISCAVRAFNLRETLPQGGNNVLGFIQAEGGLGKICDAVWIGNVERGRLLRRADNLRHDWRFAESAYNFIMVAMANED